ncbi:murein biosynthesis integral membrane protein MurJ [Patescibacteria group bacterium]|nr:murein biosynthesis integral membrane protein MurJ [Patescibacteria group bacterium]
MRKPALNKNGIFFVMSILLVTKILGFIKLRTIAQLFGVSHELDIFWAAFTIPDMLFTILVAGSINAAIIPIFSEVFYKEGKERLDNFFNHLSLIISGMTALIALLFFIFTPQITDLILTSSVLQSALNFSQNIDLTDYNMFVFLTRIMLLSPILLGFSSIITAYLQVQKQFFTTSLAPLFYNLALIIGPVIFVVFGKMGVEGIAISAVLGSLLHLLIQLPVFMSNYKNRYSISFSTIKAAFKDSKVVKAVKLAIPRTIGIIGEQVNTVVNTLISFSLAAGALSSYRYALSLHQFPINIIGSAVAQLALPDLAKHCDLENREKFKKIFNSSVQFALYLVLPIIAIFVVLRLPIVRLVYGSGAFDWRATILTSWCLVLLSFSILGQTIDQIILRAFYALKETWMPLIGIAISIVVNIVLAYLLTNFFSHYFDWRPILQQMLSQISHADGVGFWNVFQSFIQDFWRWSTTRGTSDMAVGGLSLGLGISYVFEVIILYMLLNAKTKMITFANTVKPFLIKLLNTVLMGIGMYLLFKLFDFKLDTSKTMYVILLSVATSAYGVLSYWVGSRVFKIEEVYLFEKKLKKILLKIFKNKKNEESF